MEIYRLAVLFGPVRYAHPSSLNAVANKYRNLVIFGESAIATTLFQ